MWDLNKELELNTGLSFIKCKYKDMRIVSGTNTEFYVLDHGNQAAIMAKFGAFMLNPDLFQTTFGTFPDF